MKTYISLVVIFMMMIHSEHAVYAKTEPYENKQSIYLTFDDGPNQYTNTILDLLKKEKVKATFFVLGPNAASHKTVLNRIVKEGHTIGLHGMSHKPKEFYKKPQTGVKEMKDAQKIVQDITGITTAIVRTPYGSKPYMTSPYRKAMKKAGFQMWDWNVDSEDWKKPQNKKKSRKIIEQHIQYNDRRNRASIILMHDQAINPKSLSITIENLKKQKKIFRTAADATNPFNYYNSWGN